MVFDADFYGIGAPLKQLFISRSHRIKDLVKGLLEDAVNDESRSDRLFLSYVRMLRDVNAALTKLGFPVRLSALKESDLQRGFLEFKADFFLPIKKDLKTKLTALVIWTQIRWVFQLIIYFLLTKNKIAANHIPPKSFHTSSDHSSKGVLRP